MKKHYLNQSKIKVMISLLFALLVVGCDQNQPPEPKPEPEPETTMYVVFDDKVLEGYILSIEPAIDKDSDGQITYEEALALTKIDLNFEYIEDVVDAKTVKSLKGLEHFTNIDTLKLKFHKVSDATPIRNLNKMSLLVLGGNPINEIDVTKMIELNDLRLYDTNISTIDITNNSKLKEIYLQRTKITTLDLTPLKSLINAYVSEGKMQSLKADNLENVKWIDVVKAELTELSISNCPNLFQVHANGNRLSTVTLQNLPTLMILSLYNNQLEQINISELPMLMNCFLFSNKLTDIDFSNNTRLRTVMLSENDLVRVDFGNCPDIETLEMIHMPKLELINLKNDFFDSWNEYSIVLGNVSMKKVICDPGGEVEYVKRLFKDNPNVEIVTE